MPSDTDPDDELTVGDLTPAELATVVRHGVRAAVWDVLGTLVALAFALLLGLVGLQLVFAGAGEPLDSPRALGPLAVGVVLLAGAAYTLWSVYRE
ncbi:MAG: hypothetical protein ABEJ04_01965 [Halobacteriaceae archaeon]